MQDIECRSCSRKVTKNENQSNACSTELYMRTFSAVISSKLVMGGTSGTSERSDLVMLVRSFSIFNDTARSGVRA